MSILIIYILILAATYIAYRWSVNRRQECADPDTGKTVTFGDASAVTSNRIASIISVITLFIIWGMFTGSSLVPLHVPGPFTGDTSFRYTAMNEAGEQDKATVYIRVGEKGKTLDLPGLPEASQQGFARDDAVKMTAWRSKLVRPHRNDDGGKHEQYRIVAVDDQPITPNQSVRVDDGQVTMTEKGSLMFVPDTGWQMEPIWLPAPEAVFYRLVEIARDGYQNVTLLENVGWSLLRVIAGFLLGSLIGIPLGYAMGLNSWFRGWFDPIVEFMRPIPPLALIPLIIIWFGIWETGKISLLFLAALWIMAIAARAGVSGVSLSKIHAAYSLGASRFQVLTRVIMPNSLPEIFIGARVAMGVCWGTVVAAELVAAEKGAGKMIIAASKFQQTDIVIMGIILIGMIGFGIDILMRKLERLLLPWEGKG